jgi:hypothetical protein
MEAAELSAIDAEIRAGRDVGERLCRLVAHVATTISLEELIAGHRKEQRNA